MKTVEEFMIEVSRIYTVLAEKHGGIDVNEIPPLEFVVLSVAVSSAYKDAYESGDSDGMVAANERLTMLTNEKIRYDSYKPKPAQQQPMPQYTQAPVQEASVDDKAIDWASRNEWFQKDKAMTGYAYGIHEELVEQGVDPRSDEYYQQIDSKMREAFPHKFGHQRQQGSVVAPASRSSKSPRKVTLTQSQVALAKRLGISPETYAAQLMKETR